jgi:hypothetical protein
MKPLNLMYLNAPCCLGGPSTAAVYSQGTPAQHENPPTSEILLVTLLAHNNTYNILTAVH